MSTMLELPDEREAAQAAEAVRGFGHFLSHAGQPETITLRPADDIDVGEVTVPRAAFDLFLDVLSNMANGNAVTLVPVQAELTTQQAADLLNVSRPFLVKLLEDGDIPFRKVGTRRRVLAQDLLDYKRRDDDQRRRVADELTKDAQAHGLGYQ
jgi:excisionase family DNA binding protein